MVPLRDRLRALEQELPVVSGTGVAGATGGSLTARETEVLRLLSDGLSNRLIAERLTITVGTVGDHVASILRRAGAANRSEAAVFAVRQGLG